MKYDPARWRNASDYERAQWRARPIRRLILFWEDIRICAEWTRLDLFAPRETTAERRWMKRQLLYFEAAGFIERRIAKKIGVNNQTARITEFRVRHGT